MGNANDDYEDPGASGPPPIDDPGGPLTNAVTGAANSDPDAPPLGREDEDQGDAITGDYASQKNDALEAEIARRGLDVPEEGSGKDGAVVKADLVAVLEDDDEAKA